MMVVLMCLIIALLLVCLAMGLLFIVYTYVLWTSTLREDGRLHRAAGAWKVPKGLSSAELERLGGTADGGSMVGEECSVCLEDIEERQVARVLPDCGHAFHRPCADRWLSAHAECPICRAHLNPPPPLPPPVPPSVAVQVVVCA